MGIVNQVDVPIVRRHLREQNQIRQSNSPHRPRVRQRCVQIRTVARVARRFTFSNAAQFPPKDNKANLPRVTFPIKHVDIVRGLDLGARRLVGRRLKMVK